MLKFKNISNKAVGVLNNLNKDNFIGKNLIHTSAILYYPVSGNEEVNRIIELAIDRESSIRNARLSELSLIKYEEKGVEEDSIDLGISSYKESFPWFVDEEDKLIDYHKPLSLFNGVKLVSHYLETSYRLNKDQLSEVKITEILEPFQDNEKVTVLELYNHISRLYNNDKENFNKLFEKGTSESSNSSAGGDGIGRGEEGIDTNTIGNLLQSEKPFGKYGDITINELAVSLKHLKWDEILNHGKIVVHTAPLCMNLISFSFILRGYMKYVHNKPYPRNLTLQQLTVEKNLRNRNLALFLLLGAPLTLFSIRTTSLSIKDLASIELFSGGGSSTDSQSSNTSSLFLFLSNVNKKLPNWVKILLALLIVSILVVKYLGIIYILNINTFYIKLYFYIGFSVAIFYQLLSIYLLHKFSKKNINIPEVLPDFIINWLKELEIMSSSKEGIKHLKSLIYIEIIVYILLMILFTLIA